MQMYGFVWPQADHTIRPSFYHPIENKDPPPLRSGRRGSLIYTKISGFENVRGSLIYMIFGGGTLFSVGPILRHRLQIPFFSGALRAPKD